MRTYDRDHAAWAAEQGQLLRSGKLDGVDREHVAAELDRLRSADMDVIKERIRVLLTALLRWAYQVDVRSVALSSTIMAQRHAIERILDDSVSLRPIARELVIDIYPEAKQAAVIESGLFTESFPEGLPFLPDEVFDASFLPDPFGDDAIRGDA